jgi:co-chaperonin GroES (HSP10)
MLLESWSVTADNLILGEIKGSDRTDSGLYVPQSSSERDIILKAQIIKKGPGCKSSDKDGVGKSQQIHAQLEEGQTILFDVRHSTLFEHNGHKLRVLKAENVIAIIE